jgi:POT family proton-dependent oligopeptide transporter
MSRYRTAPDPTQTKMPGGIPYIIGNELAERFSFYGMKGILTVFMTKYLLDAAGTPAYMSDEQAKTWYHLFTAAAYFFPLLGAIISDVLWGKYKTILLISLMYCVGHGCLALMDVGPATGLWDMKPLLFAGLILIAIGAGGIKPCVSANVGDQFGTGNKRLLTQVFNWFYFSINLGAAMSTLMTPVLLATVGPWAAFGLPGVLMGIATFVFWLGRHKFVHVPPAGLKSFVQETFSPDGMRAIRSLAPLFLIFVPVFWAIFDQTGSAWVLQAEKMNRQFVGMLWLESQVQAVNPILILTLIPVFTYLVYPFMGKFFNPSPLRKIGIGLFLTAGAFGISALIEAAIQSQSAEVAAAIWAALNEAGHAGSGSLDAALGLAQTPIESGGAGWTQKELQPFLETMPSIGWQFLAYVILTSAEIMVSIVCLEFAYTQAPPRMKSFIMGIYFLGVSLGNLVTAGVNKFIEIPAITDAGTGEVIQEAGSKLGAVEYYVYFAALMLVASVVYVFFAKFFYKGKTYIQGEVTNAIEAEAAAQGPDAR